jgi:hypothetical protein
MSQIRAALDDKDALRPEILCNVIRIAATVIGRITDHTKFRVERASCKELRKRVANLLDVLEGQSRHLRPWQINPASSKRDYGIVTFFISHLVAMHQ